MRKVIIMFLFCLLTNCENNTQPLSTQVSKNYFPLCLGYKWYYTNNGSGLSTSTIPDSQFCEITDTFTYKGYCWYKNESHFYKSGKLEATTEIEYYAKDANGIYCLTSDSSSILKIIDYPLFDKKRWHLVSSDTSTATECKASLIDSVNVNGKSYLNCYKIETSLNTMILSDSIGVIKNVHGTSYISNLSGCNF